MPEQSDPAMHTQADQPEDAADQPPGDAQPAAGATAQSAMQALARTPHTMDTHPTQNEAQPYTVSGTITLHPGAETSSSRGPQRAAAPMPQPQAILGLRNPFQENPADDPDAETRRSLLETVRQIAENAASLSKELAQDAATLHVNTYTSSDITHVDKDNVEATADLRAITRITLDGDMDVVVPQKRNGEVDDALWAIHAEMVQQAQANRAALIKTVVDAVSWLAKV